MSKEKEDEHDTAPDRGMSSTEGQSSDGSRGADAGEGERKEATTRLVRLQSSDGFEFVVPVDMVCIAMIVPGMHAVGL